MICCMFHLIIALVSFIYYYFREKMYILVRFGMISVMFHQNNESYFGSNIKL